MTQHFPTYNVSNFEGKRAEKRMGVNTETQVELCRYREMQKPVLI